RLQLGIDGARGLIENQYNGIHEESAGERDKLPLTHRYRRASLTKTLIVAGRKPADEGVRADLLRSRDDARLIRPGLAERDVCRCVFAEQKDVLQHQADPIPQLAT